MREPAWDAKAVRGMAGDFPVITMPVPSAAEPQPLLRYAARAAVLSGSSAWVNHSRRVGHHFRRA
jgi:hypothetical protein